MFVLFSFDVIAFVFAEKNIIYGWFCFYLPMIYSFRNQKNQPFDQYWRKHQTNFIEAMWMLTLTWCLDTQITCVSIKDVFLFGLMMFYVLNQFFVFGKFVWLCWCDISSNVSFNSKIRTENRRKTNTTATSDLNSKCAALEMSKFNFFFVSIFRNAYPWFGLMFRIQRD